MLQTKLYRKSKHILYSITFFFSFENPIVYEIMRKHLVKPGRPQITIWRMRIASQTYKSTNRMCHTYCSSTVTFLHERASMLRYSTLPVLFCLLKLISCHATESGRSKDLLLPSSESMIIKPIDSSETSLDEGSSWEWRRVMLLLQSAESKGWQNENFKLKIIAFLRLTNIKLSS
jgi:hypothetical protein